MTVNFSGNYATQNNNHYARNLVVTTAGAAGIGAIGGYVKEANNVDGFIKILGGKPAAEGYTKAGTLAKELKDSFVKTAIENKGTGQTGALRKEFNGLIGKIFGEENYKAVIKKIKAEGDETVCKAAIDRLKNCKVKSALIGAAVVGAVGFGIAAIANHIKKSSAEKAAQ